MLLLKMDSDVPSLTDSVSSRFADILGLELNMIKVFTDEIPRVPISAFTDLDLDPSEYQVPHGHGYYVHC